MSTTPVTSIGAPSSALAGTGLAPARPVRVGARRFRTAGRCGPRGSASVSAPPVRALRTGLLIDSPLWRDTGKPPWALPAFTHVAHVGRNGYNNTDSPGQAVENSASAPESEDPDRGF